MADRGLMQSGPTLYEAERLRQQAGSRGLLAAVGEPMSYAPGPVGMMGNAMLGAQYLTGEKPLDEGMSALAMMTGLLQGTKVAPIIKGARMVGEYGAPKPVGHSQESASGHFGLTEHGRRQQGERYAAIVKGYTEAVKRGETPEVAQVLAEIEREKLAAMQRGQVADERTLRHLTYKLDDLRQKQAAEYLGK